MISGPRKPTWRHRQRGYVLLVLLLAIALLSIAFLTMIERIDFQIKRDREEELIHRGVEYSRAVRKYVKKFGRYPNNIEALENTNNIRFLRKRYKDPITGKEFQVLHYGDLKMFIASIGPAQPMIPPSSLLPIAQTSAIAQKPPPGPTTNPTDGANQQASDPEGAISSDPDNPTVADPGPGAQASQVNEQAEQTRGGAAVIGVASYSKAKTIRIFNRKDHYNQWQFIYDPTTDVALIKAPHQPLLKGVTPAQPVQTGQTPDQGNSPDAAQLNPAATPGQSLAQ
jgi:type II secretory pathway pseudopilin PulG